MSSFAHDSVVPSADSNLGKKEQVAEMFDGIAHRYDFLNRFLSLGIDITWRKKALKMLLADKPKRLLDMATGTADVAIMANKILNPDEIIGVDISDGMLELGREKIVKEGLQNKIKLINGDSANIDFEDNSFDAVTVSFGVRNFEHLSKGLSEIKRVLKPGGKLVVLEFSKPKAPIIRQFYGLYMEYLAPGLGNLLSKNKNAYTYLNKSIKKFPEGKNFTQILQETGYRNTSMKPLSLGICTIYCGQK